jgi:hypothetical protein
VYPLNRGFKEKKAVYVVTRRSIKADGSVDHELIFIGETPNLSDAFENHAKSACFEKESANCVCVYWEDHEESRAKISEDLKSFYHPPCNDF